MAKFYKWNFINRAIIKNYIKKDLAKTSYSFEVDVEKEEISAYAELEINGQDRNQERKELTWRFLKGRR